MDKNLLIGLSLLLFSCGGAADSAPSSNAVSGGADAGTSDVIDVANGGSTSDGVPDVPTSDGPPSGGMTGVGGSTKIGRAHV